MKVFLQPLFGDLYPWTEQYLRNIEQVEGYEWKIFTPHKLNAGKNTEVIPMSLEEWDKKVLEATGVDPKNYIDGKAPHKNLTDYYPAYGDILKDYIKGYEYWGHTNWDCVYGRLDHFFPKKFDIFADESNEINGTLSLYRNKPEINQLYKKVEGWERVFADHKLYGFDETMFSKYAMTTGLVTCPPHYPFHSYDRLHQHVPQPNLDLIDGRLYEQFRDTITGRITGKEIAWFHFSFSKKWPIAS